MDFGIKKQLIDIVRTVDFNKTLMVRMPSTLHVDLNELTKQKWEVLVFATLGKAPSSGVN